MSPRQIALVLSLFSTLALAQEAELEILTDGQTRTRDWRVDDVVRVGDKLVVKDANGNELAQIGARPRRSRLGHLQLLLGGE